MSRNAMIALIVTVISISLAIVVSVWVYFGTAANEQHSEQKTERVTTCIENGGSWLEYTEDCLLLK